MLTQAEIAEEYEVKGKKVKTPSGWANILKVYKTIPLPVWKLKTKNFSLEASPYHLIEAKIDVFKDGSNFHEGVMHLYEIQKNDWINTQNGWEKVIFVAYTDKLEALYDITTDAPDGLFYSNGIVSHNSTTFAARQLVIPSMIPGYTSMYVVPHEEQRKTYADRLEDLQSYFRFKLGKQPRFSKSFRNQSRVYLVRCGENSASARGKSCSEVILDECQSLDPNLLDDILYTTTTSYINTAIYAGTAMSMETLLESKWANSSQGMWHVRAGDGKTWLNLRDADTLFKICSNPQGPTCPITGKLLDIASGCFVHANKRKLEQGLVGFHIPQAIIPDLCYDPVQWQKIYTKVTRNDTDKTLQECFGISVAQGSREITERDLMRLCVLRETKEQLQDKCRKGYYSAIVSGCDWGGSDYNPQMKTKTSYTVHCIIGLAPDGGVDILHYKRYSGMLYDAIVKEIIQDHRSFNAHLIASDFGVGLAYNMEIRKYIPFDKHFVVTYTGPRTAPIGEPKQAHMANQLSVNRTEAITAVFKDVKQLAPLKIRCRAWDAVKDYLSDWLNLYRAPIEDGTGAGLFKYIRNATLPDDALHAFTFAYVIMRVCKGEPLVKDPSLERRIRQIILSPGEQEARRRALESIYGKPSYVIEI